MSLITDIRFRMQRDEFEFTKHAVDRTILRHIPVAEIREAIAVGEVIESYPEDKYGPSCLILGFTRSRRPLHVRIGYAPHSLMKIITVYEPDPAEWVDFKTRR